MIKLNSFIIQALLEASRDIIADWLDGLYGSEVTDNSIFASLPKHFEEQFHQDMKALNVKITLENIHCRPEMLFSLVRKDMDVNEREKLSIFTVLLKSK
jgi:hypothetical protein